MQDTLLKYIQAAPAFESDGHEKAWLLTVAANLSKNKAPVPSPAADG